MAYIEYIWQYKDILWKYKDVINLNTLILIITVFWLRRERKKLSKDLSYNITTLQNKVDAVRDDVETSSVPGQEAQYWNELRQLWSDTRSQIEATVEALDGRVRRKYARLKRYNYKAIIDQLAQDGGIDEDTRKHLIDMNDTFFSYRSNPSRVDARVLGQYQQLRHFVKEKLAKNGDS